MGHPTEPALAIVLGENQQSISSFFFTQRNITKRVAIVGRTCSTSMVYDLACENNPQQYQRSNKKPMSYP